MNADGEPLASKRLSDSLSAKGTIGKFELDVAQTAHYGTLDSRTCLVNSWFASTAGYLLQCCPEWLGVL